MHIEEDFIEQIQDACNRMRELTQEYQENPSTETVKEYNRIYFRLEQNYTALADVLSPEKEEIEQEEPQR